MTFKASAKLVFLWIFPPPLPSGAWGPRCGVTLGGQGGKQCPQAPAPQYHLSAMWDTQEFLKGPHKIVSFWGKIQKQSLREGMANFTFSQNTDLTYLLTLIAQEKKIRVVWLV